MKKIKLKDLKGQSMDDYDIVYELVQRGRIDEEYRIIKRREGLSDDEIIKALEYGLGGYIYREKVIINTD